MAVSSAGDDHAGVADDAQIGGVTERHHAAVAEQNVEAQREQRVDQDLGREVEIEIVADDPRQRDEEHDAEQQLDRRARHSWTRPNRPCGMNTSTSNIGRNRMK